MNREAKETGCNGLERSKEMDTVDRDAKGTGTERLNGLGVLGHTLQT